MLYGTPLSGVSLGAPHNQFMAAMELEHCSKYGHNVEFTTPNYHITTTPQKEWAVVVYNAPTQDMGHERRIVPLDEMMQEPLVYEAKLSRAEVAAVVLFTGPMV